MLRTSPLVSLVVFWLKKTEDLFVLIFCPDTAYSAQVFQQAYDILSYLLYRTKGCHLQRTDE